MRFFSNRWIEFIPLRRRLITTPTGADWNSLLNYWAITDPFPGYIPENYPGLPMINNKYNAMLQEAVSYLGNAYLWGGKTPPNFDCSGFVGYLYKKYELIPQDIISYTGTLYTYVQNYEVTKSEALPGDWCFWGMGTNNQHIAIYIGNGYILDSARKGVDYRLVTYHNTAATFNGYFHVPSNERG